jgi:hypothetical protein
MQDHRIDYLQNPQRLGAVGNIDKSFFRGPMVGGTYAFVLEDDNYLLPDHIEKSIGILSGHNASVAFCNQYCEMVDIPGEPGQIGNEKTLNWMYEEGIYSPDELLPALLFSRGFSNGAAFWRTDCLSDLQIGGSTRRPEIQESLRLLRLRDSVYVARADLGLARQRPPEILHFRQTTPNQLLAFRFEWDWTRHGRERGDQLSMHRSEKIGPGAGTQLHSQKYNPGFFDF